MRTLGTIRKFKTARFIVIVDAIEDDSSVDDLTSDEETKQEMTEKLNSGEWLLFMVRARALFDGREIASDYLSGCVYESLEAFADHIACARYNRELAAKGEPGRCGSYFADMVSNVCRDARKALVTMQSVRLRTSPAAPSAFIDSDGMVCGMLYIGDGSAFANLDGTLISAPISKNGRLRLHFETDWCEVFRSVETSDELCAAKRALGLAD